MLPIYRKRTVRYILHFSMPSLQYFSYGTHAFLWSLLAARVTSLVDRPNAFTRPILSKACFAHQNAVENGISIEETEKKGLGAFAGSNMLAGAWVGEYQGEILTEKEVDARYWEKRKKVYADRQWIKSRTKRQQGITGDYLFEMGDKLYLDGEDADVSSWCRFMNHAPENCNSGLCNVETRFSRQTKDGNKIVQPKLWFLALRDIQAGEELLYDYGDSYWVGDE